MRVHRLTLLAALVAPLLALAADPEPAGKPAEAKEAGSMGGKAASRGHVLGTISSVDYGLGHLSITVGGGELITLRGTPAQLMNFKRGQVADLSFEKYGDSRWITGASSEALGNFARTSTVAGTVSSVNKADGRVTLSVGSGLTETFQAHPDAIKSLVPGQFISLTYDRVQRENWVRSIEGE